MAYKINLHDTHRTSYNNAVITAVDATPGSTESVVFEDYFGNKLGDKIYTNAGGYLCDSNGALYTNGVFVPIDAVITVMLRDGKSTSWTVCADNTETISDAKLWNADKSKILFTANASKDFVLSYNDLSDKPVLNQWGRDEQKITMLAVNDSVDVDALVSVLVVDGKYAGLTPSVVTLTLNPQQIDVVQFGQKFSVKNETGYPLKLVNSDSSLIGIIFNGDSAEVFAESNADATAIYFVMQGEDPSITEMFSFDPSAVNPQTLQITDNTAPRVIVEEVPTSATPRVAKLKTTYSLVKARWISLVWVPRSDDTRYCRNLVLVSNNNYIFKLKPNVETRVLLKAGSGNIPLSQISVIEGQYAPFGVGASEDVAPLDYIGVNEFRYKGYCLPTGATYLHENIIGAITGMPSGSTHTVHIRHSLPDAENFQMIVALDVTNIDITSGTYVTLAFELFQENSGGTIDESAPYTALSTNSFEHDTANGVLRLLVTVTQRSYAVEKLV